MPASFHVPTGPWFLPGRDRAVLGVPLAGNSTASPAILSSPYLLVIVLGVAAVAAVVAFVLLRRRAHRAKAAPPGSPLPANAPKDEGGSDVVGAATGAPVAGSVLSSAGAEPSRGAPQLPVGRPEGSVPDEELEPVPLPVPAAPSAEARCVLCGMPLPSPDAPCPSCTPSLAPVRGDPTPSSEPPLSQPPTAMSSPAVPSPPSSGTPGAEPGKTIPPTPEAAPSGIGGRRCLICGGRLEAGVCPICGMHWDD